ncbi:CIS tube protein [Roseateles terrae]|uniref:LysM domain-containing protein n=1 Tax=Roseateles terrae TaxID=431060 RepID=A0ABR6GM57_9BURK|nr:peptidoglycan-binding protein [Roseateles terrae]MBB3193205.1 hypothetical protein [Roseateles terrae]OWQ89578.1 hypothetical protein CDN98_03375 [Roseateles terrae]
MGAPSQGQASSGSGSAGDEGQLSRLLMTRYTVDRKGAITLEDKVCFKTQINPSDFKHNFTIGYNTTKDMGASKTEAKFSGTEPEEVSFSITLDDTGAVQDVQGQPSEVKAQMVLLSKVVYDYVSSAGEPPYVRLLWGALIFFGRLRSMSTQYSLFKPNGDPLRAKVDLSFVGASSTEERSLVNQRAATNDMTRTATVEDGDTLAGLCEQIYKDSSPEIQAMVARSNQLDSLTQLKPGATLVFPPKPKKAAAPAPAPAPAAGAARASTSKSKPSAANRLPRLPRPPARSK